MGDAQQPEKPTTLMRIVVAAFVAVFAWSIAGPVIFVVALLFTLGLLCGAAVALHHVGTLEIDTVFRIAHWSAVVPLVLFFVAAYAHRYIKRDAKGTGALAFRWPLLVACVVLPFLTLAVLVPAWDGTVMSPLAGAIILADLYFFSIAAFVGMAYLAFLAARTIYRWATVSRYRAGVVTGALGVPIVVLFALGYPNAAATHDRQTRLTVAERVAPARDPDALEAERKFFQLLDRELEPTHLAASTMVAAPLPTTQPTQPDDDVVSACLRELAQSDLPDVKRNVQNKFRLSDDDAHDIVYEALLNVCERHVQSKYARLGAVLQTAAERRAIDWRRRRYSRCAIESPPACTPFVDEVTRAEQLDRILDDVLCNEDPVTQRVVDLHVREEKTLVAISAELGLGPDGARTRWNNYISRARIRLAKDCGN